MVDVQLVEQTFRGTPSSSVKSQKECGCSSLSSDFDDVYTVKANALKEERMSTFVKKKNVDVRADTGRSRLWHSHGT